MNTLEHSTRDVVQSPHDKRDGDIQSDGRVELKLLLNEAIKIKRAQESFIGRINAALKKLN